MVYGREVILYLDGKFDSVFVNIINNFKLRLLRYYELIDILFFIVIILY